MKTLLVTFGVLVLVLTFSSSCCIEECNKNLMRYRSEFEKSYTLQTPGKVIVKNVSGSLRVSSWDRDEVLVKGLLRVKTKNEEDARKMMKDIKVLISSDKNSLSIEVKKKKEEKWGVFRFGSPSWSVDLQLSVPDECSLSLTGVDGSIRVRKVNGTHVLRTVDGAVNVESVKGDVRCQTVDGTCTVADIEGNVNAGTTDGPIRVSDVRGRIECHTVDGSCILRGIDGSAKVRTTDGSIKIEGVLYDLQATAVNGSVRIAAKEGSEVSDEWKLSTVDGPITLSVPGSFSADLKASTVDGRVSISVPAEFEVRTKHNAVATLREGGGLISISTTDGSIRVKQLEAH